MQKTSVPIAVLWRYLLLNTHADINECKLHNGGCDHNCTNTNGSYHCSCHYGYALKNDKLGCAGKLICTVQLHCVMSIHIVDINEYLTESSRCTQKCNNTVGSYRCYCWNGYKLANDSHTCDSKHRES